MDFKALRKMSGPELTGNLILYVIAVVFMPMGVVLTVNAHLGAGGYDAMNFALAARFGVNTSIAIFSTAFIALVLAASVRGALPRIETYVTSFLLGLFTDFWQGLLAFVQGTNLISGIVILVSGILIVAFSAACYMISVFPTNPTDDLVCALHERGMRIGTAKICFDIVCVVLAFVLGGEIGAGTIFITFGLGPVIDIFHGMVENFIKKLKTPADRG